MLHLVGHWVGPFQLVKLLGKGAMGVVYLAQDPVLRRNVALKLIAKGDETGDEEQHERFLREARAAARLIHPNVVQIFQVGETLDFRFIAMEFVEGTSLSQAAKQQGGKLSEQFGMERMREASDALALAETYGICHRDIKPSNLLLTPTGVLKVADFGLASQTGGDTIGTVAPSQLEGTPFYMSPEQWSGAPITPAADIYSLGCTFFHLLVGTTPYPARDMFGSLQAHCWGEVPDPRTLLPSLDVRLAEVLQHCMAKRPEDRPRARQITDTLDDLLMLRKSVIRSRDGARLRSDDSVTIEQTQPTLPIPGRQGRSALPPSLGMTPSAPATEPMRIATLPVPMAPLPSTPMSGTSRSVAERSYQSYYGLRDHPFSDIRQAAFYWDGGPYASALRTIASAVLSGRTCMLMGAPGSGRTFGCEMLQHKFPRIQIFSVEPQLLLGSTILVSLCRQTGVMVSESASHRFVLEAFISNVVPPATPDSVVTLVIDGFDPTDQSILQDVVLLKRHATKGRVGLILLGNEQLVADLATRREASVLCADAEPVTLRPMNQVEMMDYIEFRMSAAGSERSFELDLASQQLLYSRTGGNPKLVNVYCHNALTLAATLGEQQIRFKTIRMAMRSNAYLTPRTALMLLQDEARDKR
jgi:serine/threonine protein kinase